MQKKPLVLGLIGGVALCGSLYFLASQTETKTVENAVVEVQDQGTANPSGPQKMPTPASASGSDATEAPKTSGSPQDWDGAAFAPTLADTEIDGRLESDENGNLVVSLEVKDFFDYFLSAVGQRSLEEVMAEMERQIDSRLEPEAAAQARRLLLDYISYHQQMTTLMEQPLVPAELQTEEYYAGIMADTFSQLKQIRRQFFPPDVVDAFFGLEESFGEYAVRTLEIRADASLSDSDKAARLESLESLLPEQLVADAKEAEQRHAVADSARDAFEAGIAESEIRYLLQDVYAPEEVDSMLTFFKAEEQWQNRLDQYFSQRARIESSGLSGTDREVALDELRTRQFDEAEMNRLLSEEAIHNRQRVDG